MPYPHGAVVLRTDPYKPGKRPFLVVSDDTRPYYGNDYTLALMTSQSHGKSIAVKQSDVRDGRLKTYPSYVKPWALHETEHGTIDRQVARVSNDLLREVADAARDLMHPDY